jgi:hypothetical protein
MVCRYQQPVFSRRDFLSRWGVGFGAVALAYMQARETMAGKQGLHHEAKAEHIIFLYMDGGPSQMDTFDPKPRLTEENGQPFKMKMEPTQFDNNGATLGSPWKFNQYGQSGIPISDLFPNIAKHADRLAVVRSMTSAFSEHTSANYFLHSGIGIAGRPSMGAWATYGLGTASENLPGFIVLNGGLIPPGGIECFGNGFLPASYQASVFSPSAPALANLKPAVSAEPARLAARRSLLDSLEQMTLSQTGKHDAIESAIRNYELAYKMQMAVPEVTDLSGETEQTLQMYGCSSENAQTASYGKQCLVARRLVEQGVRFIELTCPGVGHDRWDQHANLRDGHTKNALAVDQPIGALIEDLAQRGLLEKTLIVWSGEFGRTPFAQGSDGRDHNPFAFSIWMAGGGIKGGTIYGATDEYGYKAVENPLQIHDMHATMLYLMGVDHERLTFRFSGRDMRLTDVHGHPIKDIIA